MKSEIIALLEAKNTPISRKIIELIDLFNDAELQDLRTLLCSSDSQAKRELLTQYHQQYEEVLDTILQIGLRFEETKKRYLQTRVMAESREAFGNFAEIFPKRGDFAVD